MTFVANLSDKVLVWLHGRRFGLTGDGQNLAASTSLLTLDGVAVGSSRAGTPALPLSVLGLAGAGAVTATGVAVGDSVWRVLVASTGADQTANFEATITVANQVQQLGAGAGAVQHILFYQPQS